MYQNCFLPAGTQRALHETWQVDPSDPISGFGAGHLSIFHSFALKP